MEYVTQEKDIPSDGTSSSSTRNQDEKMDCEILDNPNATRANVDQSEEEKLPFSEYEMECLRKGIKKFGSKRWLKILNYRLYCFNPLRTSESLKIRAIKLNLVKKEDIF